jgi:hypothetical protein
MKLATCCLLAAWASRLRAETYPEVEKLVRDYFRAFQAQEWKTVVAMYDPETLEVLQSTILTSGKMPKTSAEVNDDNRAAVTAMLKELAVKTPEEAWALPSATYYERVLGQINAIAPGLKDVKTTIKGIKVEKEGDEYHADAEAEAILRNKLYSSVTHFIIEPLDGKLKVVAMTKTKREPRDLKDAEKPAPAAPEAKPE